MTRPSVLRKGGGSTLLHWEVFLAACLVRGAMCEAIITALSAESKPGNASMWFNKTLPWQAVRQEDSYKAL
jgi:hypothetical protein